MSAPVVPSIRWRDRWRPPRPPADTAEITGAPARQPERLEVSFPDPVTARDSRLTVWRYPARTRPRRTLVLVHGFRGDHHGLALIADVLCALCDDVELVLPDLPGFGDSPAFPDAEHGVEHYVTALNTVLPTLVRAAGSASGRPWLLGHSFGSVVAAAWAARAPGTWAGLALVNPISEPALSPGSSLAEQLAARAAQGYYETAARLPQRWGRALLSHPAVVWATGAFMSRTDDRRILAYTHDQHQRYFSNFASRSMLVEAYRASVTGTVLDSAAGLHLPVLLIAGDKDPLGSPESQRLLSARIDEASPEVRSVMLDGVGHLIHYERPVQVAELLRDFVGAGRSEDVERVDP
ncbi:MAG: alpha/beta fold hydrolase [Micrococcaceae bacterium]